MFLAVPYLIFFGLLLGVEGAVRLALPHVSSLDLFVVAPEQQAQFDDRYRARIVEGDPLLFWRLRPNLDRVPWDLTLVSTNAQGLRYPGPVGRKRAGTMRIVCVGDSVTFGYRVPLVHPRRPDAYDPGEQAYPALIERRLRAANPGRRIEVVPLAAPGYSSHQGLAWLRREIGWLEPDVVTACFGWNDISPRARPDRVAMPLDWWHVTGRRLVASSQALGHVSLALRGRPPAAPIVAPPPHAWTMRVPQPEFVANLLEMARLAQRQGARPLLIGPVYRDRESYPPEGDYIALHRAALRAAARGAGLAYVEVPELTEAGFPGNRRLFSEHIHPNAEGHRLIAHAVVEALRGSGALPGLAVDAVQGGPQP